MPVIGMESMVTFTGLRYTQDYLTPGIYSLIKPAAMENWCHFVLKSTQSCYNMWHGPPNILQRVCGYRTKHRWALAADSLRNFRWNLFLSRMSRTQISLNIYLLFWHSRNMSNARFQITVMFWMWSHHGDITPVLQTINALSLMTPNNVISWDDVAHDLTKTRLGCWNQWCRKYCNILAMGYITG